MHIYIRLLLMKHISVVRAGILLRILLNIRNNNDVKNSLPRARNESGFYNHPNGCCNMDTARPVGTQHTVGYPRSLASLGIMRDN